MVWGSSKAKAADFTGGAAVAKTLDLTLVWKGIRHAVWHVEAVAQLQEYQDQFKASQESVREYKAAVEVKEYAAGKFLCFAGHEIPLVGIVDIKATCDILPPYLTTCTIVPSDPHLTPEEKKAAKAFDGFRSGLSSVYDELRAKVPMRSTAACGNAFGEIIIHLLSGRIIREECTAWEADILCHRLIEAWKHGK